MSEPPFGPPGDGEPADTGVRTYRGRTIEELIPRIREELGPDAIILREREGLMGGIGGFFAQRCVEIDAQAAPRLSVYDDDFDEEDDDALEDVVEEPAAPEPPPPVAAPAAEPVPAPEPRSPSPSFFDEASFAARLEEATLAVGQPPAPEATPAPAPPPARPATPTFIAFDELGDDEEATPGPPEPEAAPEPPSPPTLSHRLIDLAEVNGGEPAAEPREQIPPPAPPAPEPEPVDLAPDPSAPWMAFAAEQVEAIRPEPAAPVPPRQAPPASAAPPPMAPPTAPEPAPTVAQRTPTAPAAPQQAPLPYAPQPGGAYQPWPYGPRRRGGLLPAAERMLRAALEATHAANERRNLEMQARYMAPPQMPAPPYTPPSTPAPAPQPQAAEPPAPIRQPQATEPPATPRQPQAAAPDPEAEARARREEEHRREADLEERLTQSGVSPRRAAALVAAAISRRGPFSSDSELADELRAVIASALPAPRPVPRRGAIAVVGAGGSGKTRSVAALATAYADAGIPVSVAAFGGPAREDELGELLHAEDVNIIPAMRTRATARAVASAREESLVIIDTASATPGDGSTIDVIAEALRSFDLDATYLAVPAILSLPAALKLVAGFSAFDLTGIIATHVDETDELGMVAELAMQTSIPVAYTHTGLDLQNAIASADAGDIATSLV